MKELGAILVTGASTGIGRAAALRLAELGHVVFAGIRKEDDAESLLECAKASPVIAEGRLRPIRLDVTKPEEIQAARDDIQQYITENSRSCPGLTGLVNNAGIVVAGPVEFLSSDDWRRQFDVNFHGQIDVTRAFIPMLRESARRGARARIVLVSSISGLLGFPFLGPYCASKHALEALGDALRLELRPWKIGVTLIEPGAIKTPIWDKSRDSAEGIAANFPDEAATLYGDPLQAMLQHAETSGRRGASVEIVVRRIVQSLHSRRPRARRLVGLDARFNWLAGKFPRRWFDAVIARMLRLSSRN